MLCAYLLHNFTFISCHIPSLKCLSSHHPSNKLFPIKNIMDVCSYLTLDVEFEAAYKSKTNTQTKTQLMTKISKSKGLIK